MPEVLASWDEFSGGHWGNTGPRRAQPNQWGGVNMVLTKDGGLTPVTASRWLQLNASPLGKVWGMFWAWGADGRIYYVQQAGTSTITTRLYRFSPDPASLPNTLTTTSVFTWTPSTDVDWVELGTTVYMTLYGSFTYEINTAANTMVILTGSDGNAAAGKTIALYGERLMVGGISDFIHGNHSNRIHFSGDDSGNNPSDRTAWEALNYFDIGTDGDVISGLYNLRDYLVAVLDDQSIYLISGTPPSPPDGNLTARRVYGFHKGSGGISAFFPSHGAVDPSQTKVWLYDHTIRAPVRFNGAAFSRLPQFGVPHASRTGTDLTEGALCMIGGPDEFMAHGVAVNRAAGEEVVDHTLELIRVNGIYTLMQNDNIASRA